MEINDPAVVSKAKDIQADFKDVAGKIKFVELENMHITLKFLGNITMDTARKIYEILQKEIFLENLDIEVKKVGQFRASVLWCGIEDVQGIIAATQARIEDALASQLGIEREKRPFEGHMTLARVKFLKDKKQFMDKVRELKDTYFGTQHVPEVLLKKSQLTPRGPIYTILNF